MGWARWCPWILLVITTSLIMAILYIRGEDYLAADNMAAKASRAVHTRGPVKVPTRPRGSVLVTGGAGFIGFHVALRLATERRGEEDEVVVIDNFNSYYNVTLKQDRATTLLRHGVTVHNADLCNMRLLRHLFSEHNFTAVVHMAAQAGISHSLVDPVSYVEANIACLTVLLDVLSDYKATMLVYASSSSVYGRHSNVPFSPLAPLSPPGNMYAALKQAGEQLVSAYCTDHGISAVGLRLFTVYGPWGRPDMAVYKFAKKIISGDSIVLYEHDDHTVKRDFTYISDVADCVMLALSHTPLSCGEVYNVGRGQPVQLKTLIQYLEEELSMTAQVEVRSLPSSELPLTQADVSMTTARLGYHPSVDLHTGVKRFVEWLVDYEHSSTIRDGDDDERLLLAEKHTQSLQTSLDQKWTSNMNHIYEKRISTLRTKYKSFAKQKKIELPLATKKTFKYYAGKDSLGSTVMKALGPSTSHTIPLLEAKCRNTDQCLAFNTVGEIKSHVQPKATWINITGEGGLYVADIDVCAADLHDCPIEAHCHKTGPSQHKCVCGDNYVQLGRKCFETYTAGKHSNAESDQVLADQLDGVDWEGVVSGADFVFFQGMDTPGGDYIYVTDAVDDIPRLTAACRNTHRCTAFNTNGLLKHSVQPPHTWGHWSKRTHRGLYVLDIDYCSLALDQCPAHSSCVRHGPANYSCACHSPRSWDSAAKQCTLSHTSSLTPPTITPSPAVHVVVSVDGEHVPGLLALLNSLHTHTTTPAHLLHVHMVVSNVPSSDVEQALNCAGLQEKLTISIVKFDSSKLHGLVKVSAKSEVVGNLASAANFARFFFHELFPSLTHILYLDVDTIVQADISTLWEELVHTNQLILAAPRRSLTYKQSFRHEVDTIYYQRYGTHLRTNHPTFNAGVYGVNLHMWRMNGVHSEVLYWMKQHVQRSLWQLGTQPLLLIVAHGRWAEIDSKWNINGLGWRDNLSHEELTGAFILHWSGRRKPWLVDGQYKSYWRSHYPEQCIQT